MAFHVSFDTIASSESSSIVRRYDIDNLEAERKVRPLAIGRKNTLFFGSEEVPKIKFSPKLSTNILYINIKQKDT